MTNVPPAPLSGRGITWLHFVNRPLVAVLAVSVLATTLSYQFPLAASLSTPSIVLAGTYDLEGRTSAQPFRWTNGDAHIWFIGIGRQPYRVTMTLSSARPAGLDLPSVTVLANGTQIGSFTVPRPLRDSTYDIPAGLISASGDLDLNLKSGTFVPPSDLRTLGVALYALRVESAGARQASSLPQPGADGSAPSAGVRQATSLPQPGADGSAPSAGAQQASSLPQPVVPALLPLIWAALSTAFIFLAASARLALRAAWALALVVVALLSVGLALQRTQTVELLPWALLLSVIVFVAAHRKSPS